MSNPIADTADYFARWKQYSEHLEQDDSAAHHLDNQQQREINNSNDEATAPSRTRSQWLRVLNRISFLNPLDTATEQENNNNEESDDDSINNERDTFELIRSAAATSKSSTRHHSLIIPTSRNHSLNVSTSANGAIRGRGEEEEAQEAEAEEAEEKLPSAYDLENDHVYPLAENHDESSDYFTNPFRQQQEQHQQPIYYDTPIAASSRSTVHTLPQDQEETVEEGTSSGVKDKWDKTIDKLKFIANLQSSPTQQQQQHQSSYNLIHGPSHNLAPWYPPAFDPIFAAFAKDEYGRNVVSGYTICLCYPQTATLIFLCFIY
jgi:hypothetical protein